MNRPPISDTSQPIPQAVAWGPPTGRVNAPHDVTTRLPHGVYAYVAVFDHGVRVLTWTSPTGEISLLHDAGHTVSIYTWHEEE